MLKTDYQDDVLNTSVNQVGKYMIVNNADGSISLVDVTVYTKTGTFIGAKDINTICRNMNTIMGFIETNSGDLAQEFQDYFNEQKILFQTRVNTENADFMAEFQRLLNEFKETSENEFATWYDANTAAWSKEVYDRMDAIVESLDEMVDDNGPFVLNRAYKRYRIVTYELNNETRSYIVINPVPANQGILPTNTTYFAPTTLKGDSGIGLAWKGAWDINTPYQVNCLVAHKNGVWGSTNTSQGSEPNENSSNWTLIFKLTNDVNVITDQLTLIKYALTIIDGKLYTKETNTMVGMSLSAIEDEVTGYIYSLITIEGKLYKRRVS